MKMMVLALCLFASSIAAWSDPHASISAYAVDGKTKQILLDEQSDKSLVPASCMKVVTTAAALHLLGPEMRFETVLEYSGTLDDKGVLHGDLYIRGGGDPCLGSDRFVAWKDQIAIWVKAVQKIGIREVEGRVIGDASLWEDSQAISSWSLEDTGNYYGAGASALSFHENSYSLYFRPGEQVGDEAKVLRAEPSIPGLVLQSKVKTGPIGSGDQACIFGAEFSPIQVVRGTIPSGVEEFAIRGAIPNPAETCASLFAQALKEKRIVVKDKVLPEDLNRAAFHTTLSPPLKEIVYWTNQKSINLYAEHLLKKMGQGRVCKGIEAVRSFLASKGVDLEGFHMVDGSGLSRQNCLTARQLVSVLLLMKDSEPFIKSLPEHSGAIRAKTGSLSLVRGFAGFKGDVVFAVLVNQSQDPQAKDKIKQLVASLE